MAEITANPTDGCQVEIVEDDIKHWLATILGPTGTPYEGGQFELDFFFPEEYPHVPPEVAFRTKIYHCNVSTFGSICMDILADNWSPVLTVEKLLLSIMSLMSDANPDDPMDLEMAQLYKSNREHYDQNARYWTMRYATPASVFEPF
ncbi:ubiquitin-conjugating enzyme E2 5A-like [Drosophila obscura]|uniref:ubiquitin-conjugating enzyme E2 5A-like n=1 Tax=Drosophila obscura TaxID=7282 RepID=UPI001BB2783E|nr:ubiquitin-conjugating enzyme E2 5A-like [Drosophila obscura]